MKELCSLLLVFLCPILLYSQANCIKGDCKNGYGSSVFPSGDKYIGDFKNGRIHGKGILYYANGDKYMGHWSNQQRQGEGKMIFKAGDEYIGQFRNNTISGQGVMVYAAGNRYEGSWENGQPNGQGVFQFANGDRYEGYFLNGQCEGKGVMYYADASEYRGEWHKNMRHGQGEMITDDGQRITGKWEKNQFMADWSRLAFEGDTTSLANCNDQTCKSGIGKYIYRDGSKYIGEFVNGLPEGNGTVWYANGDRYEGGWKKHAPHGRGIMYYANGKEIGAFWDYGKPNTKLFVKEQSSPQQQIQVDQDSKIKIWAVIIGAARYLHMPALRYTDDDAYQIYAFLKSPEGGALPDNQVQLLVDEDATRANILTAMRSIFLRADANDVVMFYFSGHGLQGSFLPVDYDGHNNRIFHQEIQDMLKASKAKHKLVLADACHSGSLLAQKLPLSATLQKYYKAFENTKGGTALLMSSKGEEYSLEDGGLRSGIFSHFLVKGLKGGADNNHDKIVTVRELYSYVHKQVRVYTGNVQTPTLSGSYDSNMPVAVVRF